MQHNLREFLRHGGGGRYVFARHNGAVYGYLAGISIKSLFPGYAELRADFTDQLDRVIADNARMLLNALTPPDTVPLHNGGWAGLRPDEVPAILQRGERVLSRREAAGYGQAGGSTVNVTINARDAESFRQSRTQVASDIARAVSLGRPRWRSACSHAPGSRGSTLGYLGNHMIRRTGATDWK
jgi:hypothetical protein